MKIYLVSLAFLKALWDREKKILLDLYLPFLVELFKRKNILSFSNDVNEIQKLREQLEEEFGLQISSHAFTTLLNRAKKKDILHLKDKKYYIEEEKLNEFSLNLENANKLVEELIDAIENTGKKLFPDVTFDRNIIEKSLSDFLVQFDFQLIIDPESIKFENLQKRDQNLFILSKVIYHFHSEGGQNWDLLVNIVIGHFLSRLIFYDPNFLGAKYKDLNVFLDTRIILRLFGGEGEALKKIYEEFLSDLRNVNVKLFVFQHTLDEVRGILEGCHKWIDNPSYDPSKASIALRHFKELGYNQSDIQLILSNLENKLKKLGIEIHNTPSVSPQFQIDEKRLKEVIQEVYSSNPYFEPAYKEFTIEKDIKSISSIYQLRKGHNSQNLKNTRYLFITSNAGLSYSVFKFHKEEFKDTGFSIPACVTDTFLGTLIWVNNAKKLKSNIIPLSVITTSLSLIQPSKEFIYKWQTEIEKLKSQGIISEEQYILLRDSQLAREMLEEKTLGDPEQIVPATPIEILKRIEQKAYEEFIKEAKSHEETRKKLLAETQKRQLLEERINQISQRWAKRIVGFLLLFGVIFMSLQYFISGTIERLVSFFFSLVSFMISIIGITKERMRLWIAEKIKNSILGKRLDGNYN